MFSRAFALLAITAAACGPDGGATAAPPRRATRPAEQPVRAPDPERDPVDEAMEAAARWRAIPPPVEAATFDPDAFAWRVVPDMERFARPRAPRVTIVARDGGGGTACGGGMCSGGLESRVLRGELPADRVSYFATDRPPNHRLCEGGSERGLFQDWTIVEIAPRSNRSDPLFCGVAVRTGDNAENWVILRVATGT